MPKVKFVTDNIEVNVETGAKLIDVAQDSGSSLMFGCTDGVCGTCLVTIKSGGENLSEKGETESSTLEMLDAEPDKRLACQCKLNGDVSIENEF